MVPLYSPNATIQAAAWLRPRAVVCSSLTIHGDDSRVQGKAGSSWTEAPIPRISSELMPLFVSLQGKYRPREYWRFDTLPFLSFFLRSRALTCPLLVSVYLPLASLQTWDLQPTPVWEWELSKGPKPKQLNEDYHGNLIIGLVATCLHNIHSLFLVTELRFCLGGNVTNRITRFLELYCKNTTTR